MLGRRILELQGRHGASTRLTLALFCPTRIVLLELLSDPHRISFMEPKSLSSMLVLEIWLTRFFLAFSFIPPFIRVVEEHLPQVKPVSVSYQTVSTYNLVT